MFLYFFWDRKCVDWMNVIWSLKIIFLNIEINNIKLVKYGENKLMINKLKYWCI